MLTRSDLNKMKCYMPDCDHDHNELFLSSSCHPTSGVEVKYTKKTGVVTVTCKQCERFVADILVGDNKH